MKTIFRKTPYRILWLFYENRNTPLHLRGIARKLKLNESTVSNSLDKLVKDNVLASEKDGNLKKFFVRNKAIASVFPIFDDERLEKLPLLRKNAIREYIKNIKAGPLLMVVFGSTARENFNDGSDIDILEVYSIKTDTKEAKKHAEALTGMRLQLFQLTEKEFQREIIEKKEPVIQTAIKTGFPVLNQKYYYGVLYCE